MTFPLTERQQRVKETIAALTHRGGQAPTVRELAEHLGSSKTATHSELKLLRERGHVTWLPGRERSLMVLDDCDLGNTRLPPELQAQLDLYCSTHREDPRAVIIDAVVLHLDALEAGIPAGGVPVTMEPEA